MDTTSTRSNRNSVKILLIILLTIFSYSSYLVMADTEKSTQTTNITYNFPAGLYYIGKNADTFDGPFLILGETKVPEITQMYTTSSDGYLTIKIHPSDGPSPYVELTGRDNWTISGFTYIKKVKPQETINISLIPPLTFSDLNYSKVEGGSVTIFEIWKWPEMRGYVNVTLVSPKVLEPIIYCNPANPREGDTVLIYTQLGNQPIDFHWSIKPSQSVVTNASILELADVKAGFYNFNLTVFDEFNNSYESHRVIEVKPRLIQHDPINVEVIDVGHPEKVVIGEIAKVTICLSAQSPEPINVLLKILDTNMNILDTISDNISETGLYYYTFYIDVPIVAQTWENKISLTYTCASMETEGNLQDSYSINLIDPIKSNNHVPGFPLMTFLFTIPLLIILVRRKIE